MLTAAEAPRWRVWVQNDGELRFLAAPLPTSACVVRGFDERGQPPAVV